MTSADRVLRTELDLIVGDGQSVPRAAANTGKTEEAVFRNGQWVEFWSQAHPTGTAKPVADFSWSQSAPSSSTADVSTGVVAVSGTQTTTATTTTFTVSFNGLASFEIGGRIVAWAWTFGDGTIDTGPSPSHVYGKAATYSVTLTVTDGNGVTATVTKPVTVTGAPISQPRAAFTATVNGYSITFDGSGSASTNGATITGWAWTLGDGSTAVGRVVTHTYAGGTYTVGLTVTDSNGFSASGTQQVATSNKVPVPSFTTNIAGLAVTADASGSADPDGTITAYAWDWGDGSTNTGKTPPTHLYSKGGTYSIRLLITDNSGAQQPLTKSVSVTAPATDYIVGAASASSTLTPASISAVTQQIIRSADTGEFYSSQAHPETTGYESVRLSRMQASGALIDQMLLTDAGHGTTFALEYTGGKMYIWLNWHRATDGVTIVDDLVRFPYTAGTFTRSQVSGLTVKAAGPTYRLAAFDTGGGYAVVTNNSGHYQRHTLSKVLAGDLSSPLNKIDLGESPPTMQGFATYYDSFFRYTGVANDNSAYSTDKPTITEYSWLTGAVVRTIDTSAFGPTDGTKKEPEGLSVYNTGTNPVLFFGMTTGPTGGPHTYPTWWYPLYNPDPVVTPSPAPPPVVASSAKSPWVSGNETEGLPSTVRVVKWSSIATSASDNNDPMVAINRLTAPSVVDISGEVLTIPNFNVVPSPGYYTGLGSKNLLGFIGGINNGVFDNQIRVKNNVMTSTQLSAIASQPKDATTTDAVFRCSAAGWGSGYSTYIMGVHWVGADQGTVTEAGANLAAQYNPGPARYTGLALDTSGAGSIFQNCLVQGLNYSDGSTPPWEVGMVNLRRTNLFEVRRVELDGIIPVGSLSRPTSSTADPWGHGWKRSGGFQWNADQHPRMQDFSIHSGLVSGLTFSVASRTNNGSNNTSDIIINNLYVEDQSLKGFSGVNLEDILYGITLNNPVIKMNGSGGYHIKYNNRLKISSTDPTAPNIPSDKFVVNEPTWSGLGFNGMFSILITGYGTTQTSAPTVIKNGVKLTATTSATADPARYYYIQNSA